MHVGDSAIVHIQDVIVVSRCCIDSHDTLALTIITGRPTGDVEEGVGPITIIIADGPVPFGVSTHVNLYSVTHTSTRCTEVSLQLTQPEFIHSYGNKTVSAVTTLLQKTYQISTCGCKS